MTVTDEPPEEKLYGAAELLDMVLAAYGKGLIDGRSDSQRRLRHDHDNTTLFQAARIQAEVRAMKQQAARQYESRGYPHGYNYRGGPVDWVSGLPAGSGCAWYRKYRSSETYELAGGPQ
ncbi:hypothetical protein [Actinoplanes sp. URMC 104]|uniref:hypothetical protein n=1 Tax=Actinoplanes sp. URMC 104 TaxID=3423409 RepID=UPI003F1CF08A